MKITRKTACPLLLLGAFAALAVGYPYLAGLDLVIGRAFYDPGAVLVNISRMAGQLGGGPGSLMLAALAGIWLYRHDRAAACAVLAGVPLAWLGNALFKYSIARPRPELAHLASAHSYSFPSGHAMAGMMMGGLLVLVMQRLRPNEPRRWLAAGIVIVVLAGIARLMLGVHFFTDILAGYLLSAIMLCGIGQWLARRPASTALSHN